MMRRKINREARSFVLNGRPSPVGRTYHCRHLTRHEGLARAKTHLLHEGILQRQMIPPVYQELVLEVLWRMEVLARRLLPVTPALRTRERQTRAGLVLMSGKLTPATTQPEWISRRDWLARNTLSDAGVICAVLPVK